MPRSYADECIPTASIEEYLDRMEEVIECAPVMPFTGKCILERKEIKGLIDAIRGVIGEGREMLPSRSFQHAKTAPFAAVTIAEEIDDIPDMPSDVRTVAADRAMPAPEVEEARSEAARIIEEAKAEAVKIRTGADEYAENTLASVEQNALGAARSARKGLEVLQRRRSSGN